MAIPKISVALFYLLSQFLEPSCQVQCVKCQDGFQNHDKLYLLIALEFMVLFGGIPGVRFYKIINSALNILTV